MTLGRGISSKDQSPCLLKTVKMSLRQSGYSMQLTKQPFSQELRAWRSAIGLKQEALAHLLGVTQAAVSRWETGVDVPSRPLLLRLRDMMCASGDARLMVDNFATSRLGSLQASYDLDGVRLISNSQGMQTLWPRLSSLSDVCLNDCLVDEAAELMHDTEFVRLVRRGEVALVSAVSVKQLSLGFDGTFKHRWFATFRSYGPRMIINMTYEACAADANLGVERVFRLDELID